MGGMDEAEISNGKGRWSCVEIQFREIKRTKMKSVAGAMNFKN